MTPHTTTTPVITADGTLLLATEHGPHQRRPHRTTTARAMPRSDLLARTYHVEQLADDIGDVLCSLNVAGPLTIAGHSMGGMAALTFCARRPHRQPVQPYGLALIATAAGRLSERGLGRLLSTPAAAALTPLAAHTPTSALDHFVHTFARPVCELFSRCSHCGDPERQALCAMCGAALTGWALLLLAISGPTPSKSLFFVLAPVLALCVVDRPRHSRP